MALTDENSNGMVMPVTPMYGNGNNGGFGGDWGWIILLLLLAGGNGWGGGFGGFGGGQLGYDFPWLMNGQQGINNNVSDGFRDAQLNDNVTSVRDGIASLSTQLCGCCGDIQTNLCNGFNGVTGAVTGAQNAISQQLYTNQIADLNRSFDAQTAVTGAINGIGSQLASCCCENRLASANLQNVIQSENCADRQALNEGVRDILANQNAGIQKILDMMCADKIDSKNEKIAELQNQLNIATFNASQTAQNGYLQNALTAQTQYFLSLYPPTVAGTTTTTPATR